MMSFMKYIFAIVLVAAMSVAAYTLLPTTIGKMPPAAHGHGNEDDHDHGDPSATMNDDVVAASGIELEKAGPEILRESLQVNGMLQPNQEALVQVTPRFPGILQKVNKRVGDKVSSGDVLAHIESNQSLTSYELKAPISGTIIDRHASLGEYASEQKPLFIIADLSNVWADFAIPRRYLSRVKTGNVLVIDPEDGGKSINTKISYVAPIGASETQSALARAVVPNPDGRLRPGLFVTGRVILEEKTVPLAIRLSALQIVDGRSVVYVREGDKFESREVEIGQRDHERAEILFGISEGEVYASENSFVIKAEIAKASAAHEH